MSYNHPNHRKKIIHDYLGKNVFKVIIIISISRNADIHLKTF